MQMMAAQHDTDDEEENERDVLTARERDMDDHIESPQTYYEGSKCIWLAAMLGQATLITLDSVFARFSMKGVLM